MMKMLIERWLFFVVPFAIYGLYVLLMHRARGRAAPQTPWTTLFILGLMLVVASFIYMGLTEGGPVQGVYVAPHVANGKIVPGHVEKTK